ncbi:hypothetical protein SCHPADRAFT_612731 [Schizopora paradoxa]|uniref:Uncharacterized protein n=1 Tax=Schizopora paradoxa TaxID=27342 RepID=A0A0H2RFN0_9AGAM|nr:hypothetical protein SCHPADRAFT_612731 [Schizopora paradoxa]
MATSTIAPSRASCFIEQLPVEVMLHVFALITNEFDPLRQEPSIDVGDCNPWAKDLRNKKALNRVCKRWYDIATPALYDRIYLYRIGQLVALVRVLEESTSGGERAGYGPLVHHIHGRLLVIRRWEAVYLKHIVRLLGICKSARSLSWGAIWKRPKDGLVPMLDGQLHASLVTLHSINDELFTQTYVFAKPET